MAGGVAAGWNIVISSKPDRELKALGQPIVDALTDFEQTHGRYPRSLTEAGIENVDTEYGPFEYQYLEDGTQCCISIGDYGDDLFEISWCSEGGWYADM